MHYKPKCVKRLHECSEVCVGIACDVTNPFICSKCQTGHQKCEKIAFKELVDQYHRIQGLNSTELVRFETKVQRIFSELMKMLQDEFSKFRDEFQRFNSTEEIAHIYSCIKNGQQNSLKGTNIAQSLQQSQSKKIDFQFKKDLQLRSIRAELHQLQQRVCFRLPYIYRTGESFSKKYKDVEEMNKIKTLKDDFIVERNHLTGLIVMDHFERVQSLLGRKIYNIQLLYQASAQKFSAKVFHKLCDGYPQTLTMAITEFGRIVGGYTAVPWRKSPAWDYTTDPSGQTFLFSCSKALEGFKFEPVKNQFSLGMHQDYGPSFGDDFVIYDKADSVAACWSNFPDVYNYKYKPIPHSQKSLTEFVGAEDHFKRFKLNEWEVYKVSFSQKEQVKVTGLDEFEEI